MQYMDIPFRLSKKRLALLYAQGKSMAEIASTMKCSVHKIVYWMGKYGITRRNRSDAAYLKANPYGDPFTIKTKRTKEEEALYGLALGIYWGEGNKATPHAVRVTNTDVAIIKVFVCFLRSICQVHREKIHYSIVTFNDIDPDKASRYWARQLKISRSKFGTIVSIPQQGKGTYRKKSRYGVCTVTVGNIKLKSWIMSELEKMKNAWVV
jgi:hypothetical protein